MRVDGVNSHSGHAYGLQNVRPKDDGVEEAAQEQPGNGEDAEGVIRLLQEGHFKGVADVRLRINFLDELAAINTAQVNAVVEEKAAGVVESVGSVAESFLTENELTEEQAGGVSEAKLAFEQAVNEAEEDPVTGIKTAFGDFIAELKGLFESPADPPVLEPPAPPEEPVPDWLGFIANLEAAFATAMEELTNGLSSVSTLPPLSEPNGNGTAYDKFVAIYEDMMGANAAGDGLDEAKPEEPAE